MAINEIQRRNAFHYVEPLKMAAKSYEKPEIFKSIQVSHFISSEFVMELREHGIQISQYE